MIEIHGQEPAAAEEAALAHLVDFGEDTLLRPEQVAKALQVADSTLQAWRRQGRGPRFKPLGKTRVRYRVADVREWIRTGLMSSTSEARQLTGDA